MDGADLVSFGDDLPVIGVILLGIALLLLAVAAALFLLPALIFLLELLFIIVVVALGVAGRVLLGRPWTVEARRRGSGEVYEWKVKGWRASGELLDSIAMQLQGTGKPPAAPL